MIVAVLMAVSLVVATFLFHYAVFRWLSGGMAGIPMTAGVRILLIVLVALMAHLVEVAVYAGAYALGIAALALGSFGGLSLADPLDYFYFSIVSYTSLGFGDVFPIGHLRFITGVEALNGLLLIAWSGSFIYIAMRHLWPWQPCTEPARAAADREPGETAS
ncbi:potassium channel family protein [Hyphomonas sp.]|uniref:potassium channel family protein n=1 Tax=Alphaproteobacteria TaxID=28211 RepID=UPI003266BE04